MKKVVKEVVVVALVAAGVLAGSYGLGQMCNIHPDWWVSKAVVRFMYPWA